jgi:hypothetical protein
MTFKKLKESNKFNTLDKDQLKLINAGISPDCEGTRVIENGIVICEHYESDPDNNTNLDDCLMDF